MTYADRGAAVAVIVLGLVLIWVAVAWIDHDRGDESWREWWDSLR
jgi:hypothetical protein